MPSAMLAEPFPHATSRQSLPPTLLGKTLRWMETDAPWKLRVASFYEQWELHVEEATLPEDLRALISPTTVEALVAEFFSPARPQSIRLLEVTAHRMVAGQTIRVHNDFRPDGETHRVLVQLNRGWHDAQGGLLMLFGSGSADDVRRVIRPTHGSGLGFRISQRSFHAVSTIVAGERFTLVYSFRSEADD